jgi:hypothetical protein
MTYDLLQLSRRYTAALLLAATALPIAAQRLEVNDQGTASYHLPIAVPPGANGMAPKISIDYTASAQNGAVGFGWSLTGISMISRCRATIATDGKPGGVKWRATDKLCLDGKRLIEVDNSTGQAIVGRDNPDAASITGVNAYHEYRLESDDYSRIRAYGSAASASRPSVDAGPLFFRVWTKDGHITDYGNNPQTSDGNTNANIVGAATSTIGYPYAQSWAVSRIADIFGNHLDYKYQQQDRNWGSNAAYQSGHEWWLGEIQYSGNKVIFGYEDRTTVGDGAEGYNYGAKNVTIKRLTSVTTYVNAPGPALGGGSGAAVHTTVLAYTQSAITNRSLLSSLKLCAGASSSAKCMPATTFIYTTGGSDLYVKNANFNLAAVPLPVAHGNKLATLLTQTADFNGDGRTDILRMTYTGSTLYTSNGDGSFTENIRYNIAEPLLSDYQCYITLVADFNGDGLPDLLRLSRTTGYDTGAQAHPCNNVYPTKIFFGKGDGSFTPSAVSGADLSKIGPGIVTVGATSFSVLTEPVQLFVMDVDGDGISDLVISKFPVVTNHLYVSQGGTSDCGATVCTWVFKGNGDGSFSSLPTNLAHTSIYASGNPGANVMDMDGDGLQDIFITNQFGMVPFAVARSLGDGNFQTVGATLYHTYMPIDYKGDGRISLLSYDPAVIGATNYSPNATPTCNLWIADKSDTSFSRVTNTNICHGGDTELGDSGAPLDVGIVLEDFNGDGRQDILRWNEDDSSNGLFLSNGDGTFTKSTTFGFQGAPNNQVILGGENGVYVNGNPVGDFHGMLMGDFTGNGNLEIIATLTNFGSNTVSNNALWVKSGTDRPDLLMSVSVQNGPNDWVAYSNAPDGKVYASERNSPAAATGHVIDATANQALVSILALDVAGGVPVYTNFSYQGLKADRNGRGLLGFRVTTRQGTAPDGSQVVTQTSHGVEFPYTGMPVQESRTYLGGIGFDVTTNVYCDQSAPLSVLTAAIASYTACPIDNSVIIKRPYSVLSVMQSQDLSGAALPTRTRQTTLWGDGEPSSLTETLVGPAGASDTFKTISSFDYYSDITTCQADQQTCKWILARKKTETVEKIVPSTIATTGAGGAANASATSGPTASHALLTSAASQSFGSAWQGAASTTLSWTYQNDGVGPMTLANPTLAAPLRVASNNCSNVAMGASCAIVIADDNNVAGLNQSQSFAPTGAGNTPATATASYSVKNSLATLISASTLAVPATWYGGAAQTVTATYRNDGNSAMTLASPALAAPLSVTSNNCAGVAVGATCSMIVTAATNVPGLSQSQSFAPSGATATPASTRVTWTTKTAVPRWSPVLVDFGTVEAGTTPSKNITLFNDGNTAYNWAANNAIANYIPEAFSFDTSACGNVIPGGSCNVIVRFAPEGFVGLGSGDLTMTAASYSTNTFVVRGNSVYAPQILLTPYGFSGTSTTPQAVSTTFSINNGGMWPTTVNLSLSGGASLSTTTLYCAGTGSCGTVTVTTPNAVGNFSGTFSATSSAGGTTFSVPLTMIVLPPPVAFTMVSSITSGNSNTTTFKNPNSIAITPTDSGITSDSVFANVTSNTCKSSIAAGATCSITFTATTPDCKNNNYSASSYVTVTGSAGSAYGSTVYRSTTSGYCM